MTKEIYEKSVDKLLDAYNNGTLSHGRCGGCAVGNLLGEYTWGHDFLTSDGVQIEVDFLSSGERSKLQELYFANGFTREELMRIEFAFETAISHDYDRLAFKDKKEGQYLGLCAVLKVMESMVEEPVESHQPQLDLIAEKFNVKIHEKDMVKAPC